MLNHTGGTYSHSGMMDLSENSDCGSASWKFSGLHGKPKLESHKNDVCTRTADPQITKHWIKEVEIAKSSDELMTSRSTVGRTDFPDFDMLDAMIASALKKLPDTQILFRKTVSVEEGHKLRT